MFFRSLFKFLADKVISWTTEKRKVSQKPDFLGNLKKSTTKMIPENSILFKLKYGFKDKI